MTDFDVLYRELRIITITVQNFCGKYNFVVAYCLLFNISVNQGAAASFRQYHIQEL